MFGGGWLAHTGEDYPPKQPVTYLSLHMVLERLTLRLQFDRILWVIPREVNSPLMDFGIAEASAAVELFPM